MSSNEQRDWKEGAVDISFITFCLHRQRIPNGLADCNILMMQLLIPFYIILIKVYQCNSSSQAENGRAVRNSPAVPAPFTSSQRSLAAIKVDPSGKVYTTQILKQQLANELGLPLRDLRIVDPSFPSQIQASFISRKKCILFCIENIKVVVQHNEALVFGPFQPEVT